LFLNYKITKFHDYKFYEAHDRTIHPYQRQL